MSGLPHVRVVRGTPDDDELAALVAGLVAAASAAGDSADPVGAEVSDAWSDRARTIRAARAGWRPAPDAWRWSTR